MSRVLSLLQTAATATVLARLSRGRRRRAPLRVIERGTGDGAAITVVVPARDEARRIGPSLIEAHGALRGVVEQVCVVTLDPFEQAVQDDFVVHFVPAGTEDDDPEPDAVDQITYEGSAVDLGEATVEQLALALDPYPRKPGAALSDDVTDDPSGPFAALAGRSRLV